MGKTLRIAIFAAALAALTLVPGTAGAAIFTNGGAITIPTSGNAAPYGSTISVSGVSAPITDLNVRLNSFSHSKPFDVGVVLVGPGGQSLLLMDSVTEGGTPAQPATNLTMTVDDEAATPFPANTPLSSTSYRPTSYVIGDFFTPPGPGSSYGHPGPGGGNTQTLASIFDGTTANGTWSLYVSDFSPGSTDGGQIGAGWSLVFADPPAPAPKKKCKKGRKLKKGRCVKKKRKKKP